MSGGSASIARVDQRTASRELLVHRDYVSWTGGHGKFLDYLAHVQAHPDWRVSVHLSARSPRTADNPFAAVWPQASAWRPAQADALLLGGMDWTMLDGSAPRPVINLVQHVRHADPGSALRSFLSRPAIRVCVSEAVAQAILATGEVRGPVRVIPAAVDVAMLQALGAYQPRALVFIDAVKQHAFGREVAARLQGAGMAVDLLVERLPRPDYLRRMAAAAVVVTLPDPHEGFYLPGIEAMAMGRGLVQYDCIGSRQYLQDGKNALVPDPTPAAVAAAARALIADTDVLQRIVEGARMTARDFDLATERAQVHALLDEVDELWKQT